MMFCYVPNIDLIPRGLPLLLAHIAAPTPVSHQPIRDTCDLAISNHHLSPIKGRLTLLGPVFRKFLHQGP